MGPSDKPLSAIWAANPKALWRRYLVALSLILALLLGGHLAAMVVSMHATADSAAVALSGRQEMLSQRISNLTRRLSVDSGDEQVRSLLDDAINRFEANHEKLVADLKADQFASGTREQQNLIFFEGSETWPSLDFQVENFIASARGLQAGDNEIFNLGLVTNKDRNSDQLLETLQLSTSTFEIGAEHRADIVMKMQHWSLAAGIFVLFLEALIIFWPAHITARRAMIRLEEKSSDLITANERMQEALIQAEDARRDAEQSNQAKSMFLANMSHELRTPLNAILGFSSMIHSEILGKVGNANYVEYAEDIGTAGTHLLDLIGDIMDISRIEVGDDQLTLEDLDVPEMLPSILQIAKGWSAAHSRDIRLKLEDVPQIYRGDARRFRQIFLNLLSNAIKFTEPEDKVTITAKRHGKDGLQVIVEDTGRGFDLDDIERLTDPFRRGDSAFTRNREGVGLGLSLVAAFVKMHNGSVTFDNSETGGARVTVTLPAGNANEDATVIAA